MSTTFVWFRGQAWIGILSKVAKGSDEKKFKKLLKAMVGGKRKGNSGS